MPRIRLVEALLPMELEFFAPTFPPIAGRPISIDYWALRLDGLRSKRRTNSFQCQSARMPQTPRTGAVKIVAASTDHF